MRVRPTSLPLERIEMSDKYPQYGDFFLAKMPGVGGKLVAICQLLAGRPSKWQHCGIILENNMLLEAEPGGARIISLSNYQNSDGTYDCRFVSPPITDEQRQQTQTIADQLKGIPYSFLDYISLALLHLHIRPNWIVNRVKTSRHEICSQMVDDFYQRMNFQLFDDNRYAGDIMPADLEYLANEKGW